MVHSSRICRAFLQPGNRYGGPRINQWADSVFATLTPDERIGQLIMVAGYSNRNRASYEDSLVTLEPDAPVCLSRSRHGPPMHQRHIGERQPPLGESGKREAAKGSEESTAPPPEPLPAQPLTNPQAAKTPGGHYAPP